LGYEPRFQYGTSSTPSSDDTTTRTTPSEEGAQREDQRSGPFHALFEYHHHGLQQDEYDILTDFLGKSTSRKHGPKIDKEAKNRGGFFWKRELASGGCFYTFSRAQPQHKKTNTSSDRRIKRSGLLLATPPRT
jgi:hypothetical protein